MEFTVCTVISDGRQKAHAACFILPSQKSDEVSVRSMNCLGNIWKMAW